MSQKLVFLSPHLDDAVFSCGGLMAGLAREGHELHVVTCFTQSVPNPQGFALACQLDKGLSAEVDYMALRREEDRQACAILGATPHWLDLAEAPHRGYDSAPALFEGLQPQDRILPELNVRVQKIISELQPDMVLSPLGIGHHVDHLVVGQAVLQLQQTFPYVPYLFWYDEPYFSKHSKEVKAEVQIREPRWDSLFMLQTSVDHIPLGIDIEQEMDQKVAACAAYHSQVGFQFGGEEAIAPTLTKKMNRQIASLELIAAGVEEQ